MSGGRGGGDVCAPSRTFSEDEPPKNPVSRFIELLSKKKEDVLLLDVLAMIPLSKYIVICDGKAHKSSGWRVQGAVNCFY